MHDIAHELIIDADAERIYAAVATPSGLATWWTEPITGGTAEGDEIVVEGGDAAPAVRLRIDTLEPPLLAHLTCLEGPDEWSGTQLAFRIEPAPAGGSVVRFWHGGWEYEDGALPRASFQWAMELDALRRQMETTTA